MNKMYYPVVALALGHLVTDMQAGALPIVLPQLKELFSLSYSQLAAIVLLQNIMSSVIQPAFGYLTDRLSDATLSAALCGAGRCRLCLCGLGFQLYAAFMHGYFYQPGERYLSPAGF